MLQPRLVQPLRAFFVQMEPVGDQPGDHAPPPHVPDDLVQIRMHQRLPAADRDDRRPHVCQNIQPLLHFRQWHRLREIIEFVAVRARKITLPHGDDVHQDGVLGRHKRFPDHLQLARTRPQETQPPPQQCFRTRPVYPCFLSHERSRNPLPKLYMTCGNRAAPLSRSYHGRPQISQFV